MSESSRSAVIGRRRRASAALLCAIVAACVTVDPPTTPVEPPATPSPRALAPDPALWRTAPRSTATPPADLPTAPTPEPPIAPRRRRTPPPRDRGLDRLDIVIALPNPPAQPIGRQHPAAPTPHATDPRAVTAPAPAPPTGQDHPAAPTRHATEIAAASAPAPPTGVAPTRHATESRAVTNTAPAAPAPVPPTAREHPAASARHALPETTATSAPAPPSGAAPALPAPTPSAVPVADGPARSVDWEAGEVFNVVSEADTNAARSERADEPAGEVIEIELPGMNWIYTGRDARVAFIARDLVGDATAFTFRVVHGSVDVPLDFVATDASSGRTIEHRALVSAADRPTLESTAAVTPPQAAPRGQNPVDPPRSLGAELQAAITDPTDPADLSRLAAELIAALTPESDTDADTDTDADSRTDVNTDASDPEEAPLDPLVVPFARVLLASDLPAPAARLLDHPAVFDPGDDTIVFTLAKAYERDRLDLVRSRALYQSLIDRHPFSPHWNAAEARIEYLDRTFFLIR